MREIAKSIDYFRRSSVLPRRFCYPARARENLSPPRPKTAPVMSHFVPVPNRPWPYMTRAPPALSNYLKNFPRPPVNTGPRGAREVKPVIRNTSDLEWEMCNVLVMECIKW